jgi:hypothetical protein
VKEIIFSDKKGKCFYFSILYLQLERIIINQIGVYWERVERLINNENKYKEEFIIKSINFTRNH